MTQLNDVGFEHTYLLKVKFTIRLSWFESHLATFLLHTGTGTVCDKGHARLSENILLNV